MLTRFVRTQLLIFATISMIGVTAMAFVYMQLPTLLGIGKINVTLELPASGGLYRFGNVTYRGVQVGKVTEVRLRPGGAQATLTLDGNTKIPVDLQAGVRSVSAVGEQYVDLLPETDAGPYLVEGSVIPEKRVIMPQAVGPMLDQVSALVNSIPKDRLGTLLDETFKGLNGAGYDMQSLVDSGATIGADANRIADRTRGLIEDSTPLLDAQAEAGDSFRLWTRSLVGVTQQMVDDDSEFRTILDTGPHALNEVSRLLDQLKPTLPVLLANLTTVGKIAVTYNPSLEQMLVLMPPSIASNQSYGLAKNNPTGMLLGDFSFTLNDPPPCTVGFLPPSQWRSPEDLRDIDTPDGMYCKLPQDSPLAVRGARNFPCMGHPGKRAPTVEICDSDRPYEPLAMRPHALGPYPFDPNLLAQGIPSDDRATYGENTTLSPGGTPMPAPSGNELPGGGAPAAPNPAPQPAPAEGAVLAPTITPSAAVGGSAPERRITAATATYNPETGMYVAANGQAFVQSDLAGSAPATWKDLLPR